MTARDIPGPDDSGRQEAAPEPPPSNRAERRGTARKRAAPADRGKVRGTKFGGSTFGGSTFGGSTSRQYQNRKHG